MIKYIIKKTYRLKNVSGGLTSTADNNAVILKISKASSGDSLTVSLEGRLDTTTAPKFESEVKNGLSGVKDLVFDMSALEFISSAGLRVFCLLRRL